MSRRTTVPAVSPAYSSRGGGEDTWRAVSKLFQLLGEHNVTWDEIADRSGVSDSSLKNWRSHRGSPKMVPLAAALNALGYVLVPVKIDDAAPLIEKLNWEISAFEEGKEDVRDMLGY